MTSLAQLSDDVRALVSASPDLSWDEVTAESLMLATDASEADPAVDVDSYRLGFVVAAFIYGTDPDDDGGARETPDLPILTGAA